MEPVAVLDHWEQKCENKLLVHAAAIRAHIASLLHAGTAVPTAKKCMLISLGTLVFRRIWLLMVEKCQKYIRTPVLLGLQVNTVAGAVRQAKDGHF